MADTPIGQLRHRVLLEAALRLPDTGGGATLNWLPVAELWAGIADTSGRETVDAAGIKGRLTHEIILRPHPDLVPAHRFRLGPRVFHILAIRHNTPTSKRVTCLCEERDL
jgi:head-tail adaptor